MDLFRRSAALSYEMAYERFLDRLPELPREWLIHAPAMIMF